MKFKVNRLGKIDSTEFELNDLTIICGKNNTAKTYITYTLYGFIKFIDDLKFSVKPFFDEYFKNLDSQNSIQLPISVLNNFLYNDLVKQFSITIPDIFSGNKILFQDSQINIINHLHINNLEINRLSILGSYAIEIIKKPQNDYILVKKTKFESEDVSYNDSDIEHLIQFSLERELKSIIRNDLLKDIPRVFISSVERSGISLFQKEITLNRSNIYESIFAKLNSLNENRNKFNTYPIAIQDNLKFVQRLFFTKQTPSEFILNNNDIIGEFSNLIGGEYILDKDNEEIKFIPTDSNLQLSMIESSSSIRALCDLGIYLKFFAKFGDLIMIDEPELNLHPENQRKLGRLFAKLINKGIKILITTHSDYIIKELSILTIMYHNKDIISNINDISNVKYNESNLISPKKINVFLTEYDNGRIILKPCEIDPYNGILVSSFDDSISDINNIMDELAFMSS